MNGLRLVLLMSLLFAACEAELEPEVFGTVQVPQLTVDGCGTLAEFEIELRFDAVDDCGGTLFIRLQDSARTVDQVDGIQIEISKWEEVRAEMTAGKLSLSFDDPRLRCSLLLNEACPDVAPALACQGGALTADSLDPEGRIDFTIETDVVDLRTGDVVGPGLSVEADFEVSSGYPHKLFSYCNEP